MARVFHAQSVLGRAAAEDSRGPALLVALALLVLPPSITAATNELTGIMQKALFEEEGNHNLTAAIEGYQDIITRFDESRALTATAVFRLGECYRKQGKTNEASGQYQRIIRDFADQPTLVSLSQQNLSALTGQTGAPPLRTQAPIASISSPTIEEEEIRRIRTMTKDSPDLINARDGQNGETPLHRAVKQSQIKVIEFLLSNGADIDSRDNAGKTSLHFAAQSGDKALIDLLLSKHANVRAPDDEKWTPLHFAAQKGFRAIAELLLDRGAEIDARDKYGATPLHLAVANGYRAVADLLISRKANMAISGVMAGPGMNNLKGTPLHVAVGRTDESMAKLLLTNKAPVDAVNNEGETPLDSAIIAGNTNMVQLLLDNGADPNAKNPRNTSQQNWTPLHYAAANRQKASLALLLSHKADPNVLAPAWRWNNEDRKNYTPLLMAATIGDGEAVQVLVATGADPNLAGLNRATPLINLIRTPHASEPAQLKALEALLEHGADPNASIDNNFTPLMWAVSDADKDIVRLLIDHKADLNAKTTDHGQTALSLIISRPKQSDLPAIARMLLEAGADVNLPNKYGRTPLSYALRSPTDDYWRDLAALFEKYGGVTDVPDFNSLRLRRNGETTVVVFEQGTNRLNQFTLFQVIGHYYNDPTILRNQAGGMGRPPGGLFPFPDFSQLKIVRPVKGSLTKTENSPAYILNGEATFDCAKDTPLQFGDVIEIPAREHALNEPEVGLTQAQFDSLRGCLARKVTFKTKKAAVELPGVAFGIGNYLANALKQPSVQSLLTSSSDLKHVKVKRLDQETKKTREIVEDVQAFWDGKRPNAEEIWLQDGDIIEVPDK